MRAAIWVLTTSGMRVPAMRAASFRLPWSACVVADELGARSRPWVECRCSSDLVALPYHRSPLMPKAVSRMLTLLSALIVALPVGTNLGLLHLLWMVVSGRLLTTRGAVIPGLDACGLSRRAVRRAWAALGTGDCTSERLLAQWARLVADEGRWQTRSHGGYQPVPVDVTGFWRPRLRACPTTHYHAEAGKALPAIPVGIVARVGEVGGQRVALPLALVSAPASDPSPPGHAPALVGTALEHCAPADPPVLDARFPPALLPWAWAKP